MKKSFLSLIVLMTIMTVGQAANPSKFTSKTIQAKNLGKNKDTIPTFRLGNVTFATDNSGSTEHKNGWIRNDSTWTLYRSYGEGPLNVKADEGYWIKDLTMTYYENSGGILADNPGEKQTKIYSSKNPILFNCPEKQFYIAKAAQGDGGFICISNFTVNYYQIPTAMALKDQTVSVGNQFQLSPDFTPTNAFVLCGWESDNTEVVSIDKNGVISAKAVGTAKITATYDTLSAECNITVADTGVDESLLETFSGHGTISKYSNSVNKLTPGTSGLNWGNRNIRRSSDDTIAGQQGVSLQYRVGAIAKDMDKNYFAYADATQEGGVKRISFQWRAVDSTKNVMFQIDDCINNPVAYYSFFPASTENLTVHTLTQDVQYEKNFQFRIKLSELNSSNVVFGPMTITPYLFYKTKKAEAFLTYTNTDLIINTPDSAVTYSLEDNDNEALIDPNTGEVTCLVEGGEVTVVASWKDVRTTYTLTTHTRQKPEISFAEELVEKDLYDGIFINTLTTPTGVGDTTYTSSNENVALVNNNGEVTILAGGTATITATIGESESYIGVSKSYTLKVSYNPEEGTYWLETFSQCSTEGSANQSAKLEVLGDSSVYNWYLTFFQRRSANQDDRNNGVQGIRVRYGGSIASYNGKMEGGIKAVSFDWRTTSSSNDVDFKVNVGDTTYHYQSGIVSSKLVNFYARNIEAKENTDFSLALDSANQSFIVVSSLKITPYLLYTLKFVEVDTAEGTYINSSLINNTDEGNVTYSITEGEQVATIDPATGEVTILGKGTATIRATWGDVYTSYQLNIVGTPTALFQPKNATSEIHKVLVNDHIYIMRNAHTYDLQGNEK